MRNNTFDFLKKPDVNKKDKCKEQAKSMFVNQENEKGITTLEYVVKIARTKVASFFIQDKTSIINRFKMRIKLMEDAFDLPKHQLLALVLDIGLYTLENIVNTNAEDFDMGENRDSMLATIKELNKLNELENIIAMWEPIYKARGPEGFMEWCEDTKQPQELVDKFISTYTWVNPGMKQSSRDKNWLREYLESQPGERAKVESIKQAALDAGIIENEKDFQRLEKNAERCDVIYKDYGEWALTIDASIRGML